MVIWYIHRIAITGLAILLHCERFNFPVQCVHLLLMGYFSYAERMELAYRLFTVY